MNDKKSGLTGFLFIILTVLLLVLSICFRRAGGIIFYNIHTYIFSANYLTYDVAHISRQLTALFRHFFTMYLKGYVFPVFVFLLPAIYIAGMGIKKIVDVKFNLFSFLEDKRKEKLFLLIVCLISFVVIIAIHFLVLFDFPLVSDEYSYIFEADLIKSGKIYADSPPMPQFFKCANIVSDGKWYSKYTIGLPLLMTPGKLFNLSYVINALLAALSLVIVYLLCKEFFDRQSGALAVIILFFSPIFFLLAGTYFPHTASGFFILLLMLSLLRMEKNGGWKYSFLSAISILFILLVRPSEGGVIFMSLLPYMGYIIFKSRDKKEKLLKSIPFFAGFGLGIFILLLVNRIQTGDPFLFAFVKYRSIEKWGFGSVRHTPLKGLWNFAYSSMRQSFWLFPFIGIGAVFGVLRKKWKSVLLLFPIIGIIVFYFFYYSLGNLEFGSRYYYPVFILAVPLCAGGLTWLEERFQNKRWFPGSGFIPSFIVCCVLFVLTGILPVLIPLIQRDYKTNKRVMEWIKNPPGMTGKSLIFIRDVPDKMTRVLTRNNWKYKDQENLLALYLMPEENRELIKKFPGRKPYIIYFDYEKKWFSISPYPGKDDINAAYYIFAAINYKKSVFDESKAEMAFLKALEIEPENASIKFNLGFFYFETEQYDRGEKIFRDIIRKHPEYADAYYYLGRCLGESGRQKEAMKILIVYIRKFPGSSLVDKARDWVIYYR